jgi:hypothetical protein
MGIIYPASWQFFPFEHAKYHLNNNTALSLAGAVRE